MILILLYLAASLFTVAIYFYLAYMQALLEPEWYDNLLTLPVIQSK